MGLACEVIAGFATNPGAAGAALTVAPTDTFAIRDANPGTPILLDCMWAEGAAGGFFRITSNRMHDPTQGVRLRYGANAPFALLDWEIDEPLYKTDTLIPFISGGAAETDAGYYLVYYQDLAGSAANLVRYEDVAGRIQHVIGQEVATTTSGVAGNWSAGAAINATFDLFRADQQYALLGYLSDTRLGAIAIRGPDTGNYRFGGPGGIATPFDTRGWFVRLSRWTGRPYIPVIKANNKASTLLFVSDPAISAAVNVTLIFALLG